MCNALPPLLQYPKCELHLLVRTPYSPKPFFVWKERKPYLCPQHYESES